MDDLGKNIPFFTLLRLIRCEYGQMLFPFLADGYSAALRAGASLNESPSKGRNFPLNSGDVLVGTLQQVYLFDIKAKGPSTGH